MEILVNMKAAGKRRPILEKSPYEVKEGISTLRELIGEIVELEIKSYRQRQKKGDLLEALTQQQIQEGIETGKVAFGRVYSEAEVSEDTARENALLAFEDGMYRVVLNEDELGELETSITLKPGDVLTFIRLTFLSGRLW